MVSAACGLGGCFPPLFMGATYDAATRIYSIGLRFLVVTALAALALSKGLVHCHVRRPGHWA